MQTYKQDLQANIPVRWLDAGRFFTLIELPGRVTVRFLKSGKPIAVSEDMPASYYANFPAEFDGVELVSATAQTVVFGIGDADGGTRQLSGNVTIQNANGALTGSAKTVTSASTQLLPANPARRYVLIQNRDPSGVVYIAFGAAATSANGIKLPPGQSFTSDVFAPNNAIHAIGDIASNANVLVVEG